MKSVISELSVLVTDDSLTQRQYAKGLCSELGVKDLHDAANGVDALNVLESRGVDVVLVDLGAPFGVLVRILLIHSFHIRRDGKAKRSRRAGECVDACQRRSALPGAPACDCRSEAAGSADASRSVLGRSGVSPAERLQSRFSYIDNALTLFLLVG